MKIEKNKVVTMHYTLKDDQGVTIDTSVGEDPMSFIQGIGNIIPGLENEMEGKAVGDKFDVTITPENGYGEHHPQMIQKVPRDQFQEPELEVGMMFQVNDQGNQLIARIIELDDQSVTLDANHPMAGKTLHFNIEVVEIREAHPTELAHGHVHADGNHNH